MFVVGVRDDVASSNPHDANGVQRLLKQRGADESAKDDLGHTARFYATHDPQWWSIPSKACAKDAVAPRPDAQSTGMGGCSPAPGADVDELDALVERVLGKAGGSATGTGAGAAGACSPVLTAPAVPASATVNVVSAAAVVAGHPKERQRVRVVITSDAASPIASVANKPDRRHRAHQAATSIEGDGAAVDPLAVMTAATPRSRTRVGRPGPKKTVGLRSTPAKKPPNHKARAKRSTEDGRRKKHRR